MDVVLFVFGALILILAWIMLHDTTHFEITEYCVKDPRIRENCRAVVLSDLHNQRYGRENGLLLDAIRDGKPDMVLIAGDMLTAKPGKKYDVAIDLIRELSKSYPICYGVGNHEHRLGLYRTVYGDVAREYAMDLQKAGVRMMRDERKNFNKYGISVVGAQIYHRFYQRKKKRPMKVSYLQRTLGEPDRNMFTVLLAHLPDYFPEYAKWGADLVLSGHVHGGIVRVPFWNRGVLSPALKLFPKYDGGLFEEGRSHMILSRGLGCHTIPVRLFNPGDLIFVSFEKGDACEVTQLRKKTRKKKGTRFDGNFGEAGKV